MEVLRHLHQIAPRTKVCYILCQSAIFAKNCTTPASKGAKQKQKNSYSLILIFGEVGGRKNTTNLYFTVSTHRIVCFNLGQSTVEGSDRYNHKHILKVQVTGHSLHLIRLVDERPRTGRWTNAMTSRLDAGWSHWLVAAAAL